MSDLPDLPVSRHIWATRYRAGKSETDIEATQARVARAVAQVEPRLRWKIPPAGHGDLEPEITLSHRR